MDGMGIIKGMGVTLKRFIDTYVDDIRWLGKRYYTKEGVAHRMSTKRGASSRSNIRKRNCQCPRSSASFRFCCTKKGRMGDQGALHLVWHLRQGLPAAVHLDRAHHGSQHRASGAGAEGVLSSTSISA